MKRIQGNPGVKLLECTNPVKNKWRIRWDVQQADEQNATYMEHEFNHKPSPDEIRSTVINWIDQQTDLAIIEGFSYQGAQVWLSTENQFNYKAAFDLAVQSQGATLPVKFKLGTTEQPVYREFNSVQELSLFYTAALAHIQQSLELGWHKKDSFDLQPYLIS